MRHIYVFGPPGSQKTVLMIKANADKFGTTEDSEWITLVHGPGVALYDTPPRG